MDHGVNPMGRGAAIEPYPLGMAALPDSGATEECRAERQVAALAMLIRPRQQQHPRSFSQAMPACLGYTSLGEGAILVPDCRDSLACLRQRLGCRLDCARRIASMFPGSAGSSRGLGGLCRLDK